MFDMGYEKDISEYVIYNSKIRFFFNSKISNIRYVNSKVSFE
jgi:hypothetical protein